MNDREALETYTLAELKEKVKKERQERLQNGLADEDFRVYFQKSNLTLQIELDGKKFYEIDLEGCRNSNELLDWVLHLHGKTWGCSGGLLAAVLTTFKDACHDVFGQDINTLLRSGKTLNWKNPQ